MTNVPFPPKDVDAIANVDKEFDIFGWVSLAVFLTSLAVLIIKRDRIRSLISRR